MADTFVESTFGQHGLSAIIMSNHDSKFRIEVWKWVKKTIGIQLKLFTSRYLQKEGVS